MNAGRPVFHAPRAPLAQGEQPPPGGPGVREFTVSLQQFLGRPPAIQTPEENCSRRFHHRMRSIVQRIRQANVRGILTKTNRMRQIRVRMVFHYEVRWPSFAAEARVDPLKNALAARHWIFYAVRLHEGFLRTGTGVNSLEALSASESASLVPSIASCRVSLYVSYSGPPLSIFSRTDRNSLPFDSISFSWPRISICFSLASPI